MKVKFIGVVGEELDKIEMYGKTYVKDKWTEVKDYFAQRKLANHPHFECKDAPTDVGPINQPQTIPFVQNQTVVTAGGVTVTEAELEAAKNDPLVQESGVKPTYSALIDSKASDGDNSKSGR